MSLNKKQKKQLDVEHKKLAQLRLQLSGAKKQMTIRRKSRGSSRRSPRVKDGLKS